jgi:hypothetical protein
MKKYLVLGMVAILLPPIFTSAANAALIIDTGPGVEMGNNWTLSSDLTSGNGQWLAAEFELNSTYYITDIAGWVDSTGNTGKTFTITVYGDGGEIPDTNNLLYSNQATVTGIGGGSWEGYSISWGSGLELTAGTYWLGFEVRPNDTYSGSMPSGQTSPLLNEAFNPSGSWLEYDDLDIGVRISGNPAPVPLPPALWLFGSAIAGLGLFRRSER